MKRTYLVELSVRAQRFVDGLDAKTHKLVEEKIRRLGLNPVPSDAKFLGRHSGEKVFRIRLGKFRILYTINDSRPEILIHQIDKRSRVYGRYN